MVGRVTRRAILPLILGIALGFIAGHATATSRIAPAALDRSDLRPVVVPERPEASEYRPAGGDASPSPVAVLEQPVAEPSLASATDRPTPVPESSSTPAAGSGNAAVVGTSGSEVPRGAGVSVTGRASWFCKPGVSACTKGYPASGMFAAAGPALRIGAWRGRTVTVTANGRSVRVTLADWCQCWAGTSRERVIDLYAVAFREVVDPTWYPGKLDAKGKPIPDPLSRGIYTVRVTL